MFITKEIGLMAFNLKTWYVNDGLNTYKLFLILLLF